MNTSIIKNKNSGFTIVELLIVIVVIGILAAIVIVAFNGVQARANTSAAQSAAQTVIKKAQAYNTVEGSFPTIDEFTYNRTSGTTTGTNTGPQEARLDGAASLVSAASGVTTTNGKNTVYYERASATCVRVHYMDYTVGSGTITTTSSAGNKSYSAGC